jgi:hypothetical protein
MPTPDGPGTFSLADLVTRQGGLIEGSRDYFPRPEEPLFREDLIRELDRLSLDVSPADESWVTGITAGQSGSSSTFGALTSLAQWWGHRGPGARVRICATPSP